MLTVNILFVEVLEILEYQMLIVFQGNATTNDLWSALSAASNKDVTGFMVCSAHSSSYYFYLSNDPSGPLDSKNRFSLGDCQ